VSLLSDEEGWLLHKDKPPTGWVYGSHRDHVRMDRFRRAEEAGADFYQVKLEEAIAAGTVAEATHTKKASGTNKRLPTAAARWNTHTHTTLTTCHKILHTRVLRSPNESLFRLQLAGYTGHTVGTFSPSTSAQVRLSEEGHPREEIDGLREG
jgi:hypothetical protein